MAIVSYAAQKTLSPSGLRAASRQTEGLLRIPSRLQSAIDRFLGEYSTNEIKKSVTRLSVSMRNTKAALQQIDDSHWLEEEDASNRNSQKWIKKLEFRGQVFNKYRQRDSCAYVAARMPAVYSAVYRVLHEISRRLPDFKPSHILDYGSGPGTAIWALCEVWPRTMEHANIVEPSEAMSFARRSMFQGIKEDLPRIKNFKSFEGFVREIRPADREHNLVIASYSLGELRTAEERISVARQLWGLTSDILIIIEPGHPRGSNIVREIRSHILCMENKRLWRQSKKMQESGECTTTCLTSQGKRIGAFVVAPCAHDGICPMDGTEKYCHFSQRLARSSSQLLYKRPKGKSLRSYEDEKFSFVILRRGTRPRMEWPLDRVDPSTLDANKKKNRSFYGVIVEEPEGGFDDDEEEAEEEESMTSDSEEVDEEEEEEEEVEEEEESTTSDGEEVDEDISVEEPSEEDTDKDVTRSSEDIGEDSELSSSLQDDKVTEGSDVSNTEDEELSEGSCTEVELSSEQGSDGNEDAESEEEKDADSVIADMGSGWGRILFHPIRRGKRVIVDVCCSANRSGTKGILDRITLSSTTNKVLHFQARRSKWGDLWPCGGARGRV